MLVYSLIKLIDCSSFQILYLSFIITWVGIGGGREIGGRGGREIGGRGGREIGGRGGREIGGRERAGRGGREIGGRGGREGTTNIIVPLFLFEWSHLPFNKTCQHIS